MVTRIDLKSFATKQDVKEIVREETADIRDEQLRQGVLLEKMDSDIGAIAESVSDAPQTTNFNIVSSAVGNVGAVIQGASGQTADLLDIENGSATNVVTVGNTGNLTVTGNSKFTGSGDSSTVAGTGVLLRNSTNSTNAFEIQNTAGTSNLFVADTTDSRVGIGTNAPGNLLSIGALTTASASSQVAVSTGGATNSGIVIQTVASQSSDFFLQAQNSSGTNLASIDYQGNLIVQAATVNGSLTLNGHLITGGSGLANNDYCTITFNTAYGSAPRVVLGGGNTSGSDMDPYADNVSTTQFSIGSVNTATTGAGTYSVNYIVAQ